MGGHHVVHSPVHLSALLGCRMVGPFHHNSLFTEGLTSMLCLNMPEQQQS